MQKGANNSVLSYFDTLIPPEKESALKRLKMAKNRKLS